ncbi:GHMP family kinase ATP-binding protein [Terriglobus albidus]|uniref:GHMP family kinase ATP-binding protein n=1 Tax=Terriglobus albidus TaxID=1592106 RepID=UPI0021DF4CA6|nr:galactokinase family protein [Terriglobus albidus]
MPSLISSEPESHGVEEQVTAALAAVHGFFIPEDSIMLARAPGRLDVMGGNVDYTGGAVLQGLLREAVWAACQSRSDDTVRVLNPGASCYGWTTSFEVSLSALRDEDAIQTICNAEEGSFWGRYVLGAVYFVISQFEGTGTKGLNLFLHSDLPPNKGVSSSAALTIAALKAISAAWEIPLSGVALAIAGQWVENVVAGAACGIMDQAAIVLGKDSHLLPLLCQPCLPSPAIALPDDLCIWGIDSLAPRSTTDTAYATARAAAFMGYRMLCEKEELTVIADKSSGIPRWVDARWNGYLSNLPHPEFRLRYEYWLPERLTGSEFIERYGEHLDPFTTIEPSREYPVRAAVRYATEENFRVRMVSSLLEATSWDASESCLRLIGKILYQSHHAYTECGLGSRKCDDLVERALKAGFPGAKMTGGGAGGVVAILGRASDRPILLRLAEEYALDCGAAPHLFEGSSDGADTFGIRTLQFKAGEGWVCF